jgi:peptidoglycan/LPS O-acetylase OafA/YrhL
LRIFPAHIATLFLTAIVLATVGGSWWPSQTVPADAEAWARNVFLIGTQGLDRGRLNPVAWTLTVELFYYLVIPFLAANLTRCIAWVVVSAAVTIFLAQIGYAAQIYWIASASLPFSIGALLAYAPPLKKGVGAMLISASVGLFLLYALSTSVGKPEFAARYLYPIVAVQSLMIIALINLKDARLGALDQAVGNLAYPIFLSHAAALCLLSGTGIIDGKGFGALALVLPLTLVFSVLIHWLVERPLVSVRRGVRASPRCATRTIPEVAMMRIPGSSGQ